MLSFYVCHSVDVISFQYEVELGGQGAEGGVHFPVDIEGEHFHAKEFSHGLLE